MAVAGLISPMSLKIAVIVLSLFCSGAALPDPVSTVFQFPVDTSLLCSGPALTDPVSTVFQFPVGTFVENIAIRWNGDILVTLLTTPELYLLTSPQVGQPTLVHEFTGYNSLTGIAEYAPDVFAVMTRESTLAALDLTPGTWAVWTVDMRGVQLLPNGTLTRPPAVSKITDVLNVTLNGMSLLSQERATLLLGDFVGGQIFRLDVNTQSYQLVIADFYTASADIGLPEFPPLGVDGLHVRGNSVYIANVGKEFFARVPINDDGTPSGDGAIVAHATWQFDDFTFDSDGNAYVATGSGNSILRVSPDGSSQVVIAGVVDSVLIAEPTSCAFGRGSSDRNILYVTTAGGLAIPINGTVVGGQVLAITTDAKGARTLF